MSVIDISGIDKATLIAELFNHARPAGWGFLQNLSDEAGSLKISRESVIATLGEDLEYVSLDSPNGRMMDIIIDDDTLIHYVYDRHNGKGLAEKIVAKIRAQMAADSAPKLDGPKAP